MSALLWLDEVSEQSSGGEGERRTLLLLGSLL